MQTLKLFLSPQVDMPDDVLQATGRRLKGYFDRVCMSQTPRKFLTTTFKVNPHAGEVGDQDLLVYFTQASCILNLMDRVFDPSIKHELEPGHFGGGTKKLPNGEVLSEVYRTGEVMHLKNSTSDNRAVALANFTFHEWAHNKHASDPTALRNGEDPRGLYVHNFCGGHVLSSMTINQAGSWDISTGNIAAMARVLDARNKQSLAGLYNDDLGY
jgi:hypothetical protein